MRINLIRSIVIGCTLGTFAAAGLFMLAPYAEAQASRSVHVDTRHSAAFKCYLVATTATTSTQITGCEVVTGKSYYITQVTLTGDAASTTSAPATLQSGTSTACTGPHVLWSAYHPAVSAATATFPVPLKVTVSEGLCLLDAVAGTKTATVTGYLE